MKNNKKNLKQIIYTIIITVMLISLVYVATRDNSYVGELPTEDIIKSEELQIYFFNVGQADCILVRNNGKNMLIDAGDNEDGPLLVKYIKRLGIRKIDYLIGTHVHEDHIGGMDNIIREFDIGEIYIPYTTNKSKRKFYEDVINEVKQKELSINYKKVGDKFELGEAKCEIKSIDNSDPTSSSKINSTSIVIQMEANSNKYLFMGDAEDDVETNSKITWEDIDVLKVGHHGSDTSSTEQFINKVLPEVAVISVNCNTNSYGHPSEIVMKRLQNKECQIYRTDMNGTILLINENGTNKVKMLNTKVNAGK